MSRQFAIFTAALIFYTRIPCPWYRYESWHLGKATRYFSLVGLVVGALAGLSGLLANYLFNPLLAAIACIVTAIVICGGFHEDGFMDSIDGFGGAFEAQRVLEIMKDSRIGSYAALACWSMLSLKAVALSLIITHFSHMPAAVVLLCMAYHGLARASACLVMFQIPYARLDELSKAKPIAKDYSFKELVGCVCFSLPALALLALLHPWFCVVAVLCVLLAKVLANYFKRRLGGYTGDCLGASQQLAELVILLGIAALCKFI